MKFKIGTAKLNAVLASVAKGVGSKKSMPVTEYIRFNLFDGVLSITATDINNFITYQLEDKIEGANGTAVIHAATLIKLAKQTTKPEMTLTLKDTHLEVKGNGTYKVQLYTFGEDEEFPTYEFSPEAADPVEIHAQVLKKAFKVNEAAIAKDDQIPFFMGYLVGENVVTSDGLKMCVNNVKFTDTPMLITQRLADLIQTIGDEKVYVQKEGNKLLFTSKNIIVFGTELDGIDDYPDISGLLGVEYETHVTVAKAELLAALNRLALFVDPFDNNGVRFCFGNGGLTLEDLKKNSSESLAVQADSKIEDAEIILNLNFVKELLSVLEHPTVKIEYGPGMPIRVKENAVTLVLSDMGSQEEDSEGPTEE